MAQQRVNPPPALPIPRSFAADREVLNWTSALNTILFQLWKRTGGGTDSVSGLQDVAMALNEDITSLSAATDDSVAMLAADIATHETHLSTLDATTASHTTTLTSHSSTLTTHTADLNTLAKLGLMNNG